VQGQTFLALRIRTDRNQIVTIPSSVVLNSSVTNYTRRGMEAQTLLHTGVTSDTTPGAPYTNSSSRRPWKPRMC
jgi:small-conductance mechanosensitive channel